MRHEIARGTLHDILKQTGLYTGMSSASFCEHGCSKFYPHRHVVWAA
jgi:hypothetical protein